jgi:hypothetical protein
MQTTNNNIKIVRLQSGEDIIADFIEDNDNDTVLLDNPMHIIFKRIPTGQTVMMMMPWLPLEIIKDNSAMIYISDILTVINPKDEMIKYYGDVVVEAQQQMEKKFPKLYADDEEEEDDDEEDTELDDDEDITSLEDIIEAMKSKNKGTLH